MFFAIFIIGISFATHLFAEDAREIMQKVIDRYDGTTQISRQKLSTCRYVKRGKKIVCGETPRIKVIETVKKDYGPKERDHKSIMIILDPSGERGVGFLQYDYDNPERDTDQWMYLSALGKLKRLVSGSNNEPKQGSLFGTEFSTEDVEAMRLDDYTYRIMKSETYHQRPCWVIEITPTPTRFRKSNYSRHIVWADKERFIILKVILFNRQGKRVKRITNRKIVQIDGVWVARQIHLNNLETRRMTTLSMEAIAFNIPVENSFLRKRTLTDRAFREGKLRELRRYLK